MAYSRTRECNFLEKYCIAPSPSRDYYGLRVTDKQVLLYVWRVARGSTGRSGVRSELLQDFQEHTSFRNEIAGLFGEETITHILAVARGDAPYLPNLPIHLLLNILQNLDLGDIARLARVCTRLHEATQSNALWKKLCIKESFKQITVETEKRAAVVGWKRLLKSMVLLSGNRRSVKTSHAKIVENSKQQILVPTGTLVEFETTKKSHRATKTNKMTIKTGREHEVERTPIGSIKDKPEIHNQLRERRQSDTKPLNNIIDTSHGLTVDPVTCKRSSGLVILKAKEDVKMKLKCYEETISTDSPILKGNFKETSTRKTASIANNLNIQQEKNEAICESVSNSSIGIDCRTRFNCTIEDTSTTVDVFKTQNSIFPKFTCGTPKTARSIVNINTNISTYKPSSRPTTCNGTNSTGNKAMRDEMLHVTKYHRPKKESIKTTKQKLHKRKTKEVAGSNVRTEDGAQSQISGANDTTYTRKIAQDTVSESEIRCRSKTCPTQPVKVASKRDLKGQLHDNAIHAFNKEKVQNVKSGNKMLHSSRQDIKHTKQNK